MEGPQGRARARSRRRLTPPRGGAGVELLTLSALRALLHHSAAGAEVEYAGHFAAEDDTWTQLLVALLESLQKQPQQNSLQLIAR